ncbi:MAG: hypothetical protein PHR39_05505 [Actinomycetota bacterium]|nr:hypothetical protein [Actinomycetota bacterium]
MPNSLIEAVKNYSIKEAAPILKEFVEQEEFSIDIRKIRKRRAPRI